MKYNLVLDILNQSYQHRNVENSWEKKQNKNKNSCCTLIKVRNVKMRFKKTCRVNANHLEKTKSPVAQS